MKQSADRIVRGIGLRRWLVAGLALVVAGTIAAEAGAPVDPVPTPKPRPGFAPAASPVAEPVSGIRLGRKNKQQPPAATNAPAGSQQEILLNITSYFNRFRTMEGDFIQFGPHGEQSEGVFYISRPGKIRFQYKPPVKLDVISDGRNVSVLNTRTMTQDFYPLNKTPLRYLLADNINLTSPGLVDEVRMEPDLIAVVIVEKSKFVNGKLTLVFDRHSYELKQWIVTDAQGLNTSVAVYNVTTGKKSDPSLFKINYYLSQ
ncbi:MAG TPA: outer-membrane lipoprotein carrier protein LolA [Bauldia sp.]|nr:outer-membrane lipoprotein carrier protein LolA [Bauldia sp.]